MSHFFGQVIESHVPIALFKEFFKLCFSSLMSRRSTSASFTTTSAKSQKNAHYHHSMSSSTTMENSCSFLHPTHHFCFNMGCGGAPHYGWLGLQRVSNGPLSLSSLTHNITLTYLDADASCLRLSLVGLAFGGLNTALNQLLHQERTRTKNCKDVA